MSFIEACSSSLDQLSDFPLWRNIIPYVSEQGRCLAPDLVGMGQSEKSPTYAYRFVDHARYLDALVWPRQLPIEGEPADVTAIVESYGKAMSQSALPKLLIAGEPGVIIRGHILQFCRSWPNQTEVKVKGLHFLQEDSPDEIGKALQEFVKSVR